MTPPANKPHQGCAPSSAWVDYHLLPPSARPLPAADQRQYDHDARARLQALHPGRVVELGPGVGVREGADVE